MQTKTTVRKQLNKLAKMDPTQIASALGDDYCDGVPGSATACPIARYLRRTTDAKSILVWHKRVQYTKIPKGSGPFGPYGRYGPYRKQHATLPLSVQQFLKAYDSGVIQIRTEYIGAPA